MAFEETTVDTSTPMLFTGNAHRALAEDVAQRLGVPLGKALVGNFSDGEVQIEIEENVRRQEVFVLQPTGAPSAENLFELLTLVDALKRASAASVTAVMPYFGYARQDRRPRSARVPITAKLAAKMIGAAGVDRVLTVDLHADQIQGFFDMPVDNVYASPVLLADIWRSHNMDDLIVVSPDVGGVVRARAIAKRLDDADLAIIDKRRPQANVATVMNIIGDVEGKTCVLVDDIVDTAGTLCAAAAALKERGARKVDGLLRAPGAVGRGDRQHRRLAAGPAGGHQHLAAAARGAGLRQDPPALGGRAAGRNHPPHRLRRVGEFAVRGLTFGAGRGRRVSCPLRRPVLNPDLPWSRGSHPAAARRPNTNQGRIQWPRLIHQGAEPQGRGERCEPPPASRGLRPAVVYGAGKEPQSIQIEHNTVLLAAKHEWFFSSVLDLNVDGDVQKVLRARLAEAPVQAADDAHGLPAHRRERCRARARPAALPQPGKSPAGKMSGVVVSHNLTEVEVPACPRICPSSSRSTWPTSSPGDIVHLSELKLPANVDIPELHQGETHDIAVVTANAVKRGSRRGAAAEAER